MKKAVVFTNEADFRGWFEKSLSQFGIRKIILSQEVCPDYVVVMEDGRDAKVEAELFAINFRYHRHDPAKVDFIVACYAKTDEVNGVPVRAVHRLWCFDPEPFDLLSPSDALSEDEAALLSAIHQSGGLSLSALSRGKLAGDQEIWIRMSPEKIAAIPKGRIEDSILNTLTQSTKAWIRKYHHLLIGVGISQSGCQLLESLHRRQLIGHRPINFMASVYDGVIVDHPAWLPVEVYATPLTWEHHKDEILQYLLGGPRNDERKLHNE
ncbi:MAG: hypothetical protein F9K13_12825 [Candidatus Methylomirabilis oxygeniifera]|uniref:Uncharacterized protein n=1 Tax=Methylomirabilis oxygeniifera TaxID=671143 RepID=D5MI29_METO1|nr:MAG: hypothetical protein F9K13_12825 [Candidatus Methylomirabilis oxyfera]CBE69322.1 protein of unknown function [Candidatus Methylomirabilis oxyfera]